MATTLVSVMGLPSCALPGRPSRRDVTRRADPLRSGLLRCTVMAAAGSGKAIKEGDTGKGHRSPSERHLEVEEGSLQQGGGDEDGTCRAPKTCSRN